jgi:hypothetical protein
MLDSPSTHHLSTVTFDRIYKIYKIDLMSEVKIDARPKITLSDLDFANQVYLVNSVNPVKDLPLIIASSLLFSWWEEKQLSWLLPRLVSSCLPRLAGWCVSVPLRVASPALLLDRSCLPSPQA